MICAESLCCGTPIVGFKAGAPEMISLSEYSRFCEYGDVDTLRLLLFQLLQEEFNTEDIRNKAKNEYSKEKMVQAYKKLYEVLLN